MSTELTKPPADLKAVLRLCADGRAALTKAASVVEAKDVLDQVKILEHAIKVRDLNHEAAVAASLLRVRAERRVGELLAAQVRSPALGRPRSVDGGDASSPTLNQLGLTRDESSKYQRLASVPEDRFEQGLDALEEHAREHQLQVTREAVLRATDPHGERTTDAAFDEADAFFRACDLVHQRAEAAITALRFGHFPGQGPVDANNVFMTAAVLSIKRARTAVDRAQAAIEQVLKEGRR